MKKLFATALALTVSAGGLFGLSACGGPSASLIARSKRRL